MLNSLKSVQRAGDGIGRLPVEPRIGDRAFCAGYRLPTYRVVNGLDLVPEMPLASVKRLLPAKAKLTDGNLLGSLKRIAQRVPCYGHVNTLVYIDRDGLITIDADIEPQVILGACRPPLAHAAVQAEPSIGLLLPCNVVVRRTGDNETIVEALDPQVMVTMTGNPALGAVADDAAQRLKAALDSLS